MFELESRQSLNGHFRTKLEWQILTNPGGYNSGVPKAIRLVIKLDLDILPTNSFMKFGGNWIRNDQVRERTTMWSRPPAAHRPPAMGVHIIRPS